MDDSDEMKLIHSFLWDPAIESEDTKVVTLITSHKLATWVSILN